MAGGLKNIFLACLLLILLVGGLDSSRFMLSCLGYPQCRAVQFFPKCVIGAELHESSCDTVCGSHLLCRGAAMGYVCTVCISL